MFTNRTLCSLAMLLSFGAVSPLAHGAPATQPVALELLPFPLADVRLAEGALKQAMERNLDYLLSLENDSLLYAFRVNAGLPAPGTPLGGWENPTSEVRGHFVGHYLSACALMYASTGDERIKEKSATLVAELAKCQQAIGTGYLSAYPTDLFDRLESGKPAWAVYYTIHKIMAGLFDQYTLCGNVQSLEIMKGMAAYFKQRCDRFATAEELRVQLDKNEEGGISEVLWNLYSVTGDPDHRALADKLEKRTFLDPLALGQDNLAGRHGNTHIPLAIGALRRYELTGERRYFYAAEFFWDRVVTARSFATGGTTQHEVWGEPFKLAGTLGDTNHETCKTYNMLKLTRDLYCLTGDTRYAEFYERAFLNGILGTQGPEPGLYEYYVPQRTGFRRVFGSPLNAFWCCYGTGVENFAKLADSIYFHDADSLYVNLFLPSKVRWGARNVELEQQGDIPTDGGVVLIVHTPQPTRFALKIRRPEWLATSPSIRVNGEPVDASSSPYLIVDREWRDADRVEVALPAALHTVPLPDDPSSVAVMYGPLVLAGVVDPTTAHQPLKTETNIPPQPEAERTPRIYFAAETPNDLSWLKPVTGEPLRFKASSPTWPLVFKPFNEVIGERYGLYWPLIADGSDRQQRLDQENAALALWEQIERSATAEEAARLQEEVNALASTPGAAPYRDRLDMALAAVYQKTGNPEKATSLLQPYTTPFVTQSRANVLFSLIGAPQPSFENVQPIAVDSDAGDASYQPVERDGRKALASDPARGRRFIYFKLPPNCPLQGLNDTVHLTVDYYSDGTPGKILVEYDGAFSGDDHAGAYVAATPVAFAAQPGWHRAEFDCPKATFAGRQNHGAAFRVSNTEATEVILGDVRMSADVGSVQELFAAFDATALDAIDAVLPDDVKSESDHNLQQERSSTGRHLGRGYRHGDGWFGYTMKVRGDIPMELACVYWGPDEGRTFDIEIDGQVIATQRLEKIGGHKFVAVTYPIPQDLTRNKDKVTVRFIAKEGTLAGGVFQCTTKPAATPR